MSASSPARITASSLAVQGFSFLPTRRRCVCAVEVVAAISCARSGAAFAGVRVVVAFVAFRATLRDAGGLAGLPVLLTASPLTAAPFVAVAPAGTVFLAATVVFAAVALTADGFAAVALTTVALGVPFVDGAALAADPPIFADVTFFTAILGPFKVALV